MSYLGWKAGYLELELLGKGGWEAASEIWGSAPCVFIAIPGVARHGYQGFIISDFWLSFMSVGVIPFLCASYTGGSSSCQGSLQQ